MGLFSNITRPVAKAKPTPKPPPRRQYAEALSFSNIPGVPNVYNTPTISHAYRENGQTVHSGANPAAVAQRQLQAMGGVPGGPQPTNFGGMLGGNSAGGGRGGGGYGGGGGGGGPDPAAIQAMADQLFAFNASPYDLQRQGINTQYTFNPAPYEAMVGQAQGYNPDFAAMEQGAAGRIGEVNDRRAAEVQRRQQMLAELTGQVGQGYSQNMQAALRDLTAQGANVAPYVERAGQLGADVAGQGNQMLGLAGQLDQNAVNAQADALRGLSTIRMGGEANLANNRGLLLNQIAQDRAKQEAAMNIQRQQALGQVDIQQATQQQALEQARREFLLKYGIV